MPWTPSYTEQELRAAVEGATHWYDVLHALGMRYHGKSIAVARKWSQEWGIDTGHLPVAKTRRPVRKRYSEDDLRGAVARSTSWAAVLRDLGYCPTGGNWKTVKRRCTELNISTEHFDPYAASRAARQRRRIPLEEILVEHSSYARGQLKRRLFDAGLKQRRCEQCGQGEIWRGRRIGLILDHVNGIRDDNRLTNLRIDCPNCAAALDTHCGRKNRLATRFAECQHCGGRFEVRDSEQRFCSVACAARDRGARTRGRARPSARKVVRPTREQLSAEVGAEGYLAVGQKYGVSDNAVRKWVRAYEREAEEELNRPADGPPGTPARAATADSPPPGSPSGRAP